MLLQNQRTQKKDFGNKGKRENTWTDHRQRNVTWDNITDKHQQGSLNEAFELYYKEQGICPEDEWEEFFNTLVKPLPIVFRINGSGKFADALRQRFEDDFFSGFTKESLVIDGMTTANFACVCFRAFAGRGLPLTASRRHADGLTCPMGDAQLYMSTLWYAPCAGPTGR